MRWGDRWGQFEFILAVIQSVEDNYFETTVEHPTICILSCNCAKDQRKKASRQFHVPPNLVGITIRTVHWENDVTVGVIRQFRMTSASKFRFGPNRNYWKNNEPFFRVWLQEETDPRAEEAFPCHRMWWTEEKIILCDGSGVSFGKFHSILLVDIISYQSIFSMFNLQLF